MNNYMNNNTHNKANDKTFHGNKVVELRQRMVTQQRELAKHMKLAEFAEHVGLKHKNHDKNIFGQAVHFYLHHDKTYHSRAMAFTYEGPVILIYNQLLKELSPSDLEALVAHEYGHLHYEHTQFDTKPEYYFEADDYAVTFVNFDQLIKALEHIEKIMGDVRHLKLRIERLYKLKAEYKDLAA